MPNSSLDLVHSESLQHAILDIHQPLLSDSSELSSPSKDQKQKKGFLSRWSFSKSNHRSKCSSHQIALLLFALGLAIVILLVLSPTGLLAPATRKPHLIPSSRHPFVLEKVISSDYQPERSYLSWLKEAGDGVYSDITSEGIQLTNLNTNQTRLLVSRDELHSPVHGDIRLDSFTVSSDLRYVMIRSNSIKQWRHSTRANYWAFDTLTKSLHLIHPSPNGGHTNVSLAQWSPTGHSIAYVYNNDMYLLTSPTDRPLRLTSTGTPTVFNGLNDWVYEEEVFERTDALWWAPDSSKLAFLVLDESAVPDYALTVYNPQPVAGHATAYPSRKPMKYPKPGFPNPVAGIKLFDIAMFRQANSVAAATRWLILDKPFVDPDRIVTQLAWVSHSELIVRQVNRIATQEKTGYFDFATMGYSPDGLTVGKVVMDIDFAKLDGGWAEPDMSIVPILNTTASGLAPGYLDVRIDPRGYRHIAYYSPASAAQPVFLTEGDWEVQGSIQAVDLVRGLVHFVAANPSIERHVYSVELPTLAEIHDKNRKKATLRKLTSGRGSYSVNWSPFGGFFLLSYDGPQVPWQKLFIVAKPGFEEVFSSNEDLNRTLAGTDLPQVVYRTVKNSVGQDMNIKEMRPVEMDMSGQKKYPVLFKVYGGPNSQVVDMRYGIDWHHFLVSSLEYIVVYVDGRGTGFKGRQFRVPVRNQLGKVEAEDVATAARFYARLDYVDPARVGVWGWSYGGFLTCKLLESYSSDFSLGIAVAPVTDWRFYDTVYTERYMSTLQSNPEGYGTSAVTKMDGFKNVSFLLAHGSADDNVHFVNSASLLDRLTVARVEGFEFRLFIDSDHSIYTRGAQLELYKFLTRFLVNNWGVGHDSKLRLNHTSWDS